MYPLLREASIRPISNGTTAMLLEAQVLDLQEPRKLQLSLAETISEEDNRSGAQGCRNKKIQRD